MLFDYFLINLFYISLLYLKQLDVQLWLKFDKNRILDIIILILDKSWLLALFLKLN